MARGPGRNLGDDQDYTGLPDEEIRRAVLEHLEADQTVDASEIDAVVEDGSVRLVGTVGSEVEREAAAIIVTDVLGLDLAANELGVEPAVREGARAAHEPDAETAMGEPGETGGEGSGEQVTGMEEYEFEGEPELSETIGTEDPMEASDEGRSFTPPDAPSIEALAETDPPHGFAEDQPRPTNEPARQPGAEGAVGRAMREASRADLRRAATESAGQFKEEMRERERRERDRRRGPS
ncbi:MAG TPA: BON domain-containing protein [Thermodesulfobacteriota bacterium]